MTTDDKFIKDNKEYFNRHPDADFSPAKNKKVIADTIANYEANRAKRKKNFAEKLEERSDAVASYFQHLNQGKGTPLEKYFGRKELARLQGKKIYEKLTNGRIQFEEVN